MMLIAVPTFAGPHDEDYEEWKHKPNEPFSDPKKAFDEAREILLKEYLDDKLTEADLYRAAVAGMLRGAAGRKWDKLLSPGEHAELMGDLGGEMVGIGIEIRFDDESGNIVILGTVPGSPAEKGELKAGDRILKIDGKSFKGMQLRDAVYGIRGKAGQPIVLTLLREDRVITKTIIRAPITFAPVSSMMLPGSVGLVSLKAFTDKTPGLLRSALQQIVAQKPRGLVLDLRMNEGGNFHRVVDCAGLFLPKDKVVATMIHRGGNEQVLRSSGENLTAGLPIVVLVNSMTASGAEMLAGALRDEVGVRLVGKKTLGKWNVQALATLSNKYAIKYTVGLFKSPRGALLDGKGLDPDLEVDLDEASTEKAMHVPDGAARIKADPQLRAAVQLLRLEH
jgi:carboxyl-terminal processing protease